MNENRKKLEICIMLVFVLMLHNVASKDDLKFISEDYTIEFGWEPYAYYYVDTDGKIVCDTPFRHAGDFNSDGIAYTEITINNKGEECVVYGYIDNESFDFINDKLWFCNISNVDGAETSDNADILISADIHNQILTIYDENLQETGHVEDAILNDDTVYKISPNDLVMLQNINEKYGFVNSKGEWVIEPKYDYVRVFNNKYAAAKYDSKWGLIDLDGNWVIEPAYAYLTNGGDETFFLVQTDKESDYVKYIDIDGNELFGTEFYMGSGWQFSEDLMYVADKDSHLLGYINRDGEYVIEPQFLHASDFHHGVAAVSKEIDGDEKYAIIKADGEYITDFIFDNLIEFSDEGIAKVEVDNLYGYIKIDGTWLLKPQFHNVFPFENGYGVVELYQGQEINYD